MGLLGLVEATKKTKTLFRWRLFGKGAGAVIGWTRSKLNSVCHLREPPKLTMPYPNINDPLGL